MRSLQCSYLLFALLVGGLVCSTWGCAGGQTRGTESRTVQGEPPEEDPPDRMPKGPSVKVDGETPGESEGSSSDGRGATRSVPESAGDRVYVTEDGVEALLERGPAYVFQAVTVEPVERDGTFRGYRIVDVSDAAREAVEPQLRVGDVVTEVNGVPIERPDDYMAAWEKLKHRAVLEVEFRRDGASERALWYVRERVESAGPAEETRDGRR